MISSNALAGFWMLVLAVVSVLYRTKNLPRILVDSIDMVSRMLAVMATTSMSLTVWRWFGPVPEKLLSWSMAIYFAYILLSQIVGLRLTRVVMRLPIRIKRDRDR